MKRERFRKQKQKLYALIDALEAGHSFPHSLVQTFPDAPNPLLYSLKECKQAVKGSYQESPLFHVIAFLFKGISQNRNKTIELTKDLLEIYDSYYRIEKREATLQKSLFFKSYITAAGIAGSLGILTILTIYGFLQSTAFLTLGHTPHLTLWDTVNLVVTMIMSLTISLRISAATIDTTQKETLGLFIVGFTAFTATAIFAYLLISSITPAN